MAIVSGTLSNFRVRISTPPGGGDDAYTYTLMHNGAASANIACTITGAATSCTDTTLVTTEAFLGGDRISVRSQETNTDADATIVSWAADFAPS